MILLIGGAYQGKLDYARECWHLTEDDIFTCHTSETATASEPTAATDTAAAHMDFPDLHKNHIDFTKRCINQIEEFTLSCVRSHVDSVEYFRSHRQEWADSILICQDIFCGVVPLGAEMRAWRNETGRLCQYLSKEAAQVSRIFCGLEQRLK